MHKSESLQEIEAHKILLDFEIQTDHLNSARRPELVMVNSNNNKREPTE